MARSQPLAPASVPPPTPIQSCLNRLPDDPSARAELIVACRERVRMIVRRVLMRYPWLNAAEYSDDVEQDALVRLTHTLNVVPIRETVHFLRLAAKQVQRAVIDILRRDFPRWADGRVAYRIDEPLPPGEVPPTIRQGVSRLEFLDLLDRLDEWERAAIDCIHLLGMSHAETAAAHGVDERTVARWLTTAKLRLAVLLDFAPESNPE